MHIRLANLQNPSDQQTIVDLLDMYSRDPMGAGAPLAADVRTRLIPALLEQPQARIFLALKDGEPLGLAICFLGFSSFRAQPLLNIHDLAVTPDSRGTGVGRALLQAAEDEARRCGCCRLTLEVRGDNHRAQRIYRQFGFASGANETDEMLFWKKPLE